MLTQLAAGEAPDVFWIPGANIAQFAQAGVIFDLREIADADGGYSDADFYPGPMEQLTTEVESGQPGNALWGLPRDVSAYSLYLNTDLIAEAGAEDPPRPGGRRELDVGDLPRGCRSSRSSRPRD